MKFNQWPYFFKQAVRNILTNRIVHGIGLGTMVVSLLIFSMFLLLFVNLNHWVQGWGQTLSMSIYLRDDISEPSRQQITSYLQQYKTAHIKRLITKEAALQELKTNLGTHAGLLDALTQNPLPASIEVTFEQTGSRDTDLKGLKEQLEKMAGVSEVQYSEEWINKFKGIMNMVRLLGIIIIGLLSLGALFIVTNTIKLTIYSRKDEIEILKLVGATDWFVKVPFLLEGTLQGVASGILALFILFLGYLILSAKEVLFLDLAGLEFIFIPSEYMFVLLLASVLLGLMGSFIAIGRFFEQ